MSDWKAIWKITPLTEIWKNRGRMHLQGMHMKGFGIVHWKEIQVHLPAGQSTYSCLSWYTKQGQSHSVSNH